MDHRRIACVHSGVVCSVIVVPSGDAGDALLRGPYAPPRILEDGSQVPYDHFVDVSGLEIEPQPGFLFDSESGLFSSPEIQE